MPVSTKPFTKLFSSIVTSSIWNENDKVRVVWITMLALSDATGFVCASVGGLAHAARVEKKDCESALGYLCAPDDDSRSPEFAGRRIEVVEGGFLILNYTKYRELGRKLDRTEYLAAKKRESRKRLQNSTPVNTKSTNVNNGSTNASASASLSDSSVYWEELKRNPLHKGVEIEREFEKAKQWCQRKGRRCTSRFFENWLTKADRILATPVHKAKYLPPARVPTEEEFEAVKKIAAEEKAKLKTQFNR